VLSPLPCGSGSGRARCFTSRLIKPWKNRSQPFQHGILMRCLGVSLIHNHCMHKRRITNSTVDQNLGSHGNSSIPDIPHSQWSIEVIFALLSMFLMVLIPCVGLVLRICIARRKTSYSLQHPPPKFVNIQSPIGIEAEKINHRYQYRECTHRWPVAQKKAKVQGESTRHGGGGAVLTMNT
jgi:hypothetical protein